MAIDSANDFYRATRAAIAAAGFVRKETGDTIYWDSATQGAPIVMVHGANDHAGTWFAVAPSLAKTHRVILIDLPGHGESAPQQGPLPISLLVARIEAVIDDALGDARFTLVGNSLGGWLSLIYSLKHADRIAQLVLETSGGLARPPAVPLVAHTRDEAIPILRAVHGPHYEAPEWVIEALLQRATGSPLLRLTELVEHDIEPRLGEVHVPTTLVWGEHDGVLPLSYAEALRDAIPNADLRIIEGAAHIPHLQQPQRVLECLMAIC